MDNEKFSAVEIDRNSRVDPAYEGMERASAADDPVRPEIIAGLTAPQAAVASKYFYDARGSRLFEMITALPEYYLTRTERAIFSGYAEAIAAAAGTGSTLIDLGAGNCSKARHLFPSLRPAQYVAVDISLDFLRRAVGRLQPLFPAIEMLAVGGDIYPAPVLPHTVRPQRRLFFYPGSSIGNFTPDEALLFLTNLRKRCRDDGGLLIGVDLVKSEGVLNAAYDDASGVTAAFNLNLLRNLNRILGSNFATADWRHRAFFNAAQSRVEMHLEARRPVHVRWPGGGRLFTRNETLHTENSYKYRLPDFERLLSQTGFGRMRFWTDEARWFAVGHAAA